VPAPPYPNQPGSPYGYQGWPPPAPPKPKSRVGLIIGIVAGVTVLCVAAAVVLFAIGLNAANKANQLSGLAHVVAEVTGSGPTQVTVTVDGSVTETGTRPVPYTTTTDIDRGTSTRILVTARTMVAGGTASCRILVDGTVVTTRTANGFNAEASCETTI
jgi:hypothetical protein